MSLDSLGPTVGVPVTYAAPASAFKATSIHPSSAAGAVTSNYTHTDTVAASANVVSVGWLLILAVIMGVLRSRAKHSRLWHVHGDESASWLSSP